MLFLFHVFYFYVVFYTSLKADGITRIDYFGWGTELFILFYFVQMGLPSTLDVCAWLRCLVLARFCPFSLCHVLICLFILFFILTSYVFVN